MHTESRPGQRRLMRRARRSGYQPEPLAPLHPMRLVRFIGAYLAVAIVWHVASHVF